MLAKWAVKPLLKFGGSSIVEGRQYCELVKIDFSASENHVIETNKVDLDARVQDSDAAVCKEDTDAMNLLG